MPALATYEQAVSPENVAKVSLTGLSFVETGLFTAKLGPCGRGLVADAVGLHLKKPAVTGSGEGAGVDLPGACRVASGRASTPACGCR